MSNQGSGTVRPNLMNERRRFIRRVELLHVAAAACGVLLAFSLWSGDRLSGVVAGVLLGGANLRAMTLITERLTSSLDANGRNGALALLLGKLMLLIATVGAVMLLLKPDVLAFIAALSLAPAALLVVAAVARPDTSQDGGSAVSDQQPGEVL